MNDAKTDSNDEENAISESIGFSRNESETSVDKTYPSNISIEQLLIMEEDRLSYEMMNDYFGEPVSNFGMSKKYSKKRRSLDLYTLINHPNILREVFSLNVRLFAFLSKDDIINDIFLYSVGMKSIKTYKDTEVRLENIIKVASICTEVLCMDPDEPLTEEEEDNQKSSCSIIRDTVLSGSVNGFSGEQDITRSETPSPNETYLKFLRSVRRNLSSILPIFYDFLNVNEKIGSDEDKMMHGRFLGNFVKINLVLFKKFPRSMINQFLLDMLVTNGNDGSNSERTVRRIDFCQKLFSNFRFRNVYEILYMFCMQYTKYFNHNIADLIEWWRVGGCTDLSLSLLDPERNIQDHILGIQILVNMIYIHSKECQPSPALVCTSPLDIENDSCNQALYFSSYIMKEISREESLKLLKKFLVCERNGMYEQQKSSYIQILNLLIEIIRNTKVLCFKDGEAGDKVFNPSDWNNVIKFLSDNFTVFYEDLNPSNLYNILKFKHIVANGKSFPSSTVTIGKCSSVKSLISHISDSQYLLGESNTSLFQSLNDQEGVLQEYFYDTSNDSVGLLRLKIIELFSEIFTISINHNCLTSIDKAVDSNILIKKIYDFKLLHLFMDMFFYYETNNILHGIVMCLFRNLHDKVKSNLLYCLCNGVSLYSINNKGKYVMEDGSDIEYYDYDILVYDILMRYRLFDMLVLYYKTRNCLLNINNGYRFGFVGHMYLLCKTIMMILWLYRCFYRKDMQDFDINSILQISTLKNGKGFLHGYIENLFELKYMDQDDLNLMDELHDFCTYDLKTFLAYQTQILGGGNKPGSIAESFDIEDEREEDIISEYSGDYMYGNYDDNGHQQEIDFYSSKSVYDEVNCDGGEGLEIGYNDYMDGIDVALSGLSIREEDRLIEDAYIPDVFPLEPINDGIGTEEGQFNHYKADSPCESKGDKDNDLFYERYRKEKLVRYSESIARFCCSYIVNNIPGLPLKFREDITNNEDGENECTETLRKGEEDT